MNTNSRIQVFVNGLSCAAIICNYDVNNPYIIAANKAHERLTGYSREEVIGKLPTMFQGHLTDMQTDQYIKTALQEADYFSGGMINYHKSGIPRPIDMFICGVLIDSSKYYCCIKQAGGIGF